MKRTFIFLLMTSAALAALDMGIDVSHHNTKRGDINWDQVAANEPAIKFVLVKGSEGANYTDPKFETNFNGAKAKGFQTGFYHYFRTSSEGVAVSVDEQVANIGRRMSSVNFNPVTDFFVLDVEEEKKDPGLRPGPDRLSSTELSNRIKSLMDQVKQKYNTKGMIYTNNYFWNDFVHTSSVDLSRYGLWASRYPPALIGKTLSQCLCELGRYVPDLANGFTSMPYWQFTNNATVSGINGPVDANVRIPH